MINWQKIRLSLFFILVSLLLVNKMHSALAFVPPDDCDDDDQCECGYVCNNNVCTPSSLRPCPTTVPYQPDPTSVPQPPPGGVTPPPGVPTPTSPPQGGNTCQANCSGQVCGTVAGTYDCRVSPCGGNGTCDPMDGFCKRCTTPGRSCCNYCVPDGWGCGGNPCPFRQNCKGWNAEGNLICDQTIICGGTNPCSGSATSTCYTCYEDCPVFPTPTPIPVCSISNFTATKNISCGATTVNLHWTVNSPIETSYVLAFYHNGSNWSQSGFSPANPLSNTATNTTSPNFNPGSYNFQACCNKNNIKRVM